MIRGHDIVYVANDWRGENKTSAHHIAEVLSRTNRILYVEAAGQRAPRASGRDLRKIVRKLRRSLAPPVPVAEGVWTLSPLILPFHAHASVRRLNRWLLRSVVRRACRRMGFERPLLWIVLPHYASLVDSVASMGIVYYCVDEYAAQPDVDAESIRAMENQVLRRADVAFAVSDALVEAKRAVQERTYVSPHGVDVGHFRAALEPGAIPADVAAIRRPIAGFFGLIEAWIDVDLIARAARELPGVSFVLVGSVSRSVDALRGLDNVHLMGHRPYSALPDYLRAFDVGLLPYVLNAQVIHSNPKKLREYLAGGRPVVSVRVREVERYAHLVRIADGPEQFVQAIRSALAEDGPDARLARARAMEAESWEERVEAISARVAEHIPEVRNA